MKLGGPKKCLPEAQINIAPLSRLRACHEGAAALDKNEGLLVTSNVTGQGRGARTFHHYRSAGSRFLLRKLVLLGPAQANGERFH
jgi:hypothetical protein